MNYMSGYLFYHILLYSLSYIYIYIYIYIYNISKRSYSY